MKKYEVQVNGIKYQFSTEEKAFDFFYRSKAYEMKSRYRYTIRLYDYSTGVIFEYPAGSKATFTA